MDRRVIWAIVAMMIIAIVPSFFLKRPARPPVAPSVTQPPSQADTGVRANPILPETGLAPGGAPPDTGVVGDTVRVTSPIYEYDIATLGGRMAAITLPKYKSMAAQDSGRPAQILHPSSELLGLAVLAGRDTLHLDRWVFDAFGNCAQREPADNAYVHWQPEWDPRLAGVHFQARRLPDRYSRTGDRTGA